MNKRVVCISILLSLSLNLISMAEPRLEDLDLQNYSLYSTTTIDLHNAIKDSGNEYIIRCYANEKLVDEQYGLFGNQLVNYTFQDKSIVGKNVYLEIESYNLGEKCVTEKKILQSPHGVVELVRQDNIVSCAISDFDNTSEYTYEWYLGNNLVNTNIVYEIQEENLNQYLFCRVKSLQTGHTVDSKKLYLDSDAVKVIQTNKDINIKGEWIHGINGKDWFLKSDGSHPVGYKDENGIVHYDWQMIDDVWYAFDDFGYSVSGFITDFDGNDYYLENGLVFGWKEINSNWYYFNTCHDGTFGMMLRDCQTPDGYYVDADGTWIF